MAEDIWGRLFVLIGAGAMVWTIFAGGPAWIGGVVMILVGLMTIPTRKVEDDG